MNEQIIGRINESIAKLEALRAIVEQAGPALDGWTVCGGSLLCGLFQLHRQEGANPRAAAKALAKQWKRLGNKWEADMPEIPNGMRCFVAVLHDAEERHPDPQIVDLSEPEPTAEQMDTVVRFMNDGPKDPQ